MPNSVPSVDVSFFESEAAKSLVRFECDDKGQTYYHPRDGQGALGPLVSAKDFVTKSFGTHEKLPVAFLCDPGTDDALTFFMAFDKRARVQPHLVIPSFGNVSPDKTYRNALRLTALCRAFNTVVGKGAQHPMHALELPESAEGAHGGDGLGGAEEKNIHEVSEGIARLKQVPDGVQYLVDDIIHRYKESLEPITILSTGSMTDVAYTLQALLEREPEALSKIRGISIMGGGIDTQYWHTNLSAYAEFNIFQDPDAAQIAFNILQKYKIPSIMIPLDLTHQTSVREDYEGKWLFNQAAETGNPVTDFAAQLCKAKDFDVERSGPGQYNLPSVSRFMHDPNTDTILEKPEFYGGFCARIEVLTSDKKAGQTVVTPDENSNVFVAVGVDAMQVVAHWQHTLSNYECDPELT